VGGVVSFCPERPELVGTGVAEAPGVGVAAGAAEWTGLEVGAVGTLGPEVDVG